MGLSGPEKSLIISLAVSTLYMRVTDGQPDIGLRQVPRLYAQRRAIKTDYYGRTLSVASMLYFADVFYIFLIPALVGQTAERIFTKLSHVVDIRHHLRTY